MFISVACLNRLAHPIATAEWKPWKDMGNKINNVRDSSVEQSGCRFHG